MPSLCELWIIVSYLFLLLLWSTSIVNSGRETITARNGVVASDSGRCSRIGRDVLREGGNAIDAAVTTALCLGVVRPGASGIGGGSFMLVRLANGEAQGFDMRGMAPKQASQKMYAQKPSRQNRGVLSIAVPGELAGLHSAWKQYGKLPWKRLVDPAEQLARKGFKISRSHYFGMVSTKSSTKADKGLRGVFTLKGERPLKESIDYRNINLANTLMGISNNGSQALYNGSIGINLVKDVRKARGILTVEDLRRYQVKLRKPISTDILGYKILGMPPATSGGATMMLVLNILAQYGFPSNISRSLEIHRMVEAFKHAYAVRMNLGDPDFVDVKSVLSDMLSPKFAAGLRNRISPNKTFDPKYYGGKWNQIHDHGTTHFCVVDSARNAVSMTTSLNDYFGSRFLSQSTGIVLNNEMGDFSTPKSDFPPPAPANYIQPLKRALSSMTPTIILKGEKLKALLGGAGGINIPTATIEVFLNHFVKGRDPLSSIVAPRYYHTLIPNVLYYESWRSTFGGHYDVSGKILSALKKKGHVLRSVGGRTICQFVVQQLEGPNSGMLVAVSDPREGGLPAGY